MLAHTNKNRNARISANAAEAPIRRVCKIYCGEDFGLDHDNTVNVLFFTFLSLCLSQSDLTFFQSANTAINIHSLLDIRDSIHTFP